jgi:dTDP-4-dehydrorhamnose reductase
MRALVIGASGQVGAALVETLRARGHEPVGTYTRHPVDGAFPLDLTDQAAVEHAVAFVKPGWIFCPAGLSHVDYCEDHPEEALALNRDGPLHAARMGQRLGAGFVFYSTDYVFDGTAGPYGEEDPVRPLSVYGRSKREGEEALLGVVPRSIVVRTSVVYGPERQEKNFVYQLLRSARGDRRLRPAADQQASPTYNRDLAAASVELAERELGGLWHLAGPEALDRLAFARLICQAFDLDAAWLVPVRTADLGQKAPRPLQGGLRVDRARTLLATPLRGPREGLLAMRRALEAEAAAPRG